MYKIVIVIILSSIFVGCASVPLESPENQATAKNFQAPQQGSSGLYIYRNGSFGGALKKDVWVDGNCIGETAPNIFFYQEVTAGKEHTISTESEFSPNNLLVKTESGKNHFIEQYIKMGAFVGGAGLKEVTEDEGKKIVSDLKMAKKGNCSQ